MSARLFQEMIETQRYINPMNARELDQLLEAGKDNGDFEVFNKQNDIGVKIKGLQDKNEKETLLANEQKVHKLYRTFLEIVNDDMVELADRQIDTFKRAQDPAQQSVQLVQQSVLSDRSMRKPQQAWAADIDNTYAPFVPQLSHKPHSVSAIPQEITHA